MPRLLAACALFVLAASGSQAQSYPVPSHWIDGLPSDEVYVTADPLGLEAHQIVAGRVRPKAVELDLGVGSRSGEKPPEKPAVIEPPRVLAEPAAAPAAEPPRAKPRKEPRSD